MPSPQLVCETTLIKEYNRWFLSENPSPKSGLANSVPIRQMLRWAICEITCSKLASWVRGLPKSIVIRAFLSGFWAADTENLPLGSNSHVTQDERVFILQKVLGIRGRERTPAPFRTSDRIIPRH